MNAELNSWRLARRHAFLALLFALVCTLAARSPRAESLYLYLVASGIYQTDLDGSNRRLLYPQFPNSLLLEVAANSVTGAVYWIEATSIGGGTIIRRLDPGGSPTFVISRPGFRSITSLTVDEDAQKLYFSVTNGEIRRCDLDGQNPQTVLPGPGTYVAGLDVVALSPVNAKIYWTEYTGSREGRIARADVIYGFGMNRETIVDSLVSPDDVSVDALGGKIYWVDGSRARVQRANLDGSGVETLADTGLVSPSSLTIDLSSRKLLWG